MSLNFKFIPLTFLNDLEQIKEQVKNTIILSHFFDKNKDEVRLEKLIEGTQYGYNASALEAGQNKFLRISDITDGIVNWDSVPYCDCTDEKTYLLQKDDLLIARTGGTTGKSFLIDNPPSKAIYAGYLIRIRSNGKSIPNFLNLFLNSYAYWSQVLSLNKGEFRPSVNATKLKELILPKCNIQEQKDAIRISKGEKVKGYENLAKRIQETLLSFDKSQELLNEYNTQKHLLIQLKQSILQEAIQGKLTADWRKQNPTSEPASELLKRIQAEKAQLIKEKKIKKEKPLPAITKEEIPFELPEGWIWCYFRDLTKFQMGKTPATKQISYWNDGEFNWLSIRDMNDGDFIYETNKKITTLAVDEVFKSQDIVPVDTLLMSFKLTVGKVSINKIPLFHNEAIISIFPYDGIQQKFLFLFLPIITKLSVSKKVLMGQTFNSSSLSSMICPVPPESEQKEIVKKVEELMLHCQQLEQEIQISEANAQMLMQAVLKEAFEGETKKELV